MTGDNVTVMAPSAPWPFVGREHEVAAVLDELAAPDSAGVVIVGPPGAGKTRLLDEVLARVTALGRIANRAVGSTATESIPFAAISHLLPKDALLEGGTLDPVALFAEISRTLTAVLPAGQRLVAGTDDIAHLDAASLALLTQLVNANLVALVVTLRVGDSPPPALTSLEASHRIARLEVRNFDVDGITQLLEAALGGTIDRHTSRALWKTSQGNLLFVRELVLGALASGALANVSGHWRLAAPLTTTSRLVEVVTSRLATLPDSARGLAEMLAVAQPLRIDDLDRAGLGDDVALLDASGLVTATEVDGVTLVRLGHPMYGEVLASELTVLRRRRLLLDAAAAVSSAGRSDDALRLASWLTAANAPVDPTILRNAVLHARTANDFVLTERLARVACDTAPDVDMLRLLAEALYEFGRIEEADAWVAKADEYARDDGDRLRLAILRNRILLWNASNADAALEVTDAAVARFEPGPLRTHAELSSAITHAFHTNPADALPYLPQDRAALTADLLASFAHSVVWTRIGDPIDAAEVALAARAQYTGRPRLDRDEHPGLIMLSAGYALTEAGRLEEAEAIVSQAYHVVVEQTVPQLHAWLSLQLGRIAFYRGQPVTAKRWFAEGLVVSTDMHFAPGRRMALTGLAVCAGLLGDVHGAATLLAELDQVEPDIGFMGPEIALGRAWAMVALGRVSDACDVLHAGADEFGAMGDTTFRLALLYEAARVGGDRSVWKDVEGLAVTGTLAAARTDFVRGFGERSVDAFTESERAFTEMGANLAAAEAAAALASELTERGRPREAASVIARRNALLELCEGAMTPLLHDRSTVVALTPRELETAQLAARGMPSKLIARELGVSERTVSNHLQNAYVKLGISTRADLAVALGIDT
jgi:DNA-binding CsgD family transcriptional regulator/tetratricopeptide (TPR) repeat protein